MDLASKVVLKILFWLVQYALIVIILVMGVQELQHHVLSARLIFIDFEINAIVLVQNFIIHNYLANHAKIVILNVKYVRGQANVLFAWMERLQQVDYVKFNVGPIV